MQTVNIHEAKTQLSRLLEQVVASNDSFIIAKAGKPLVKVMPLHAPDASQEQRLGFLAGRIRFPMILTRWGTPK